jgi:hypothetical protein
MKTINVVLAGVLLLVATGVVQATSHSSAVDKLADAEKAEQAGK